MSSKTVGDHVYVTHFHSEIFQQVATELRTQWVDYRIVGVTEEIGDAIKSDLLGKGFWQGCYKDFDVVWRVDLEKEKLEKRQIGETPFLHVDVHPVFEVAFADQHDVFDVCVSFRHSTPALKRPAIFEHPTGAKIWDLAYFYDADHLAKTQKSRRLMGEK